jgi:hypothetical protein
VVENDDHVGIVTDIQAAADTGTCVAYKANGDKIVNGVASAYGATYTDGDVIGIAVNLVDNEVTFYKNGASQGTITGVTSGTYFHRVRFNNVPGEQAEAIGNWGQRPFAYTAPSGFKALVTTNLPEPTVVQGDDYFNTVTYTGPILSTDPSGTTGAVTGVGFSPDFVWIKARSTTNNHQLFDIVRGINTSGIGSLISNDTSEESTSNTNGGLYSLDADGFTVVAGTDSGGRSNLTGSSDRTYVAWNWKADGAGVSNGDGTITSTVSANTIAGISIVTWTGTGATGTIGHSLGSVPRMIIVKSRNAVDAWYVYHASLGATARIQLNETSAQTTGTSVWNSTSPTSTVFSIGSSNPNTSTVTYVAYCFAEVEGFSKFGSYTGNGSADGPFVYTGFRPALIIRKRTDNIGDWIMMDNKRNTYNLTDNRLLANSSNAEANNGNNIDILSNGWKERNADGYSNASGGTFIYMAFASNPFKTSLAR